MAKRIENHVFAGLAGAGDTESLCEQIGGTHWFHYEWEQCLDGIVTRWRNYGDTPTIILTGHSYGAKRCAQIASALSSYGIRVDYIAGIDPTALFPGQSPMVIGPNVDLVHEFWSEWFFPLNLPLINRKWKPSGKGGGKFVYSNPATPHKHFDIPTGHIATAGHKTTRNVIAAKVLELT